MREGRALHDLGKDGTVKPNWGNLDSVPQKCHSCSSCGKWGALPFKPVPYRYLLASEPKSVKSQWLSFDPSHVNTKTKSSRNHCSYKKKKKIMADWSHRLWLREGANRGISQVRRCFRVPRKPARWGCTNTSTLQPLCTHFFSTNVKSYPITAVAFSWGQNRFPNRAAICAVSQHAEHISVLSQGPGSTPGCSAVHQGSHPFRAAKSTVPQDPM